MKKIIGIIAVFLVLMVVGEAGAATVTVSVPMDIYLGDINGTEKTVIEEMTAGDKEVLYLWTRTGFQNINAADWDNTTGATAPNPGLSRLAYATGDITSTQVATISDPSRPNLLGNFYITALQPADNAVGSGSVEVVITPLGWDAAYDFGERRTLPLTVLEIYGKDTGGGTCGALGLGAAALLLPMALLFKRKKAS